MYDGVRTALGEPDMCLDAEGLLRVVDADDPARPSLALRLALEL